MSEEATVPDRLDRTVSVLRRTAYAAFLAFLTVFLACLALLFVVGTYGIMHQGNDFVDFGSGGGGGDIITLPLLFV